MCVCVCVYGSSPSIFKKMGKSLRPEVKLKKKKEEEEGLPWWSSGKESPFQCRGCGFDLWSGN